MDLAVGELASPFVAKQRRGPDERADKRDRQLVRSILRTASRVNRRNVAEALVRSGNLRMMEAITRRSGEPRVLDAYTGDGGLVAALLRVQ
jgi:hypothetical protein